MNKIKKIENLLFKKTKVPAQKILLLFIIVVLNFSFMLPEGTEAMGELSGMEVRLIPGNPSEREDVVVNISSFSFDVNTAEISIFLDDKLVQKGIGIKKFTFTTKDFGQKSAIKIIAKRVNGLQVIKNISITPTAVDLVYELSDSYIPFGYAGRSVAISNSALTVYAFPKLVNNKGQKITKDSLVYTWYKNSTIEPSKSGFSKSSYTIDRLDAFPRETVITVHVKTIDGKLQARGKMVFNPQRSEVEFYLLDPVLPFSFKNIANPSINSSFLDTEILAVPYFMDDIKNGKAEYKWTIGNKNYKHPDGKDKNKILLINNFEDSGFINGINISLQIKNKYRILQSYEDSFRINFSETSLEDNQDKFFNTGKVEKTSGFFGF